MLDSPADTEGGARRMCTRGVGGARGGAGRPWGEPLGLCACGHAGSGHRQPRPGGCSPETWGGSPLQEGTARDRP